MTDAPSTEEANKLANEIEHDAALPHPELDRRAWTMLRALAQDRDQLWETAAQNAKRAMLAEQRALSLELFLSDLSCPAGCVDGSVGINVPCSSCMGRGTALAAWRREQKEGEK